MKLDPAQLKFFAPFFAGLSKSWVGFAGKRNSVHLQETAMVVAIPDNGVYYVGKDSVTRDRLTEKIKAMLENRKLEDRVVYIKGGNMVSYGSIVETISAIREAGVDRIGLVTDKKKPGEQ